MITITRLNEIKWNKLRVKLNKINRKKRKKYHGLEIERKIKDKKFEKKIIFKEEKRQNQLKIKVARAKRLTKI